MRLNIFKRLRALERHIWPRGAPEGIVADESFASRLTYVEACTRKLESHLADIGRVEAWECDKCGDRSYFFTPRWQKEIHRGCEKCGGVKKVRKEQ